MANEFYVGDGSVCVCGRRGRRRGFFQFVIVPLMSNMPDALETPGKYQGNDLPPRKQEFKSFDPRRDAQNPVKITMRK